MESMDTSSATDTSGATAGATDKNGATSADPGATDKAPATERCSACQTNLMTVAAYQHHLNGAKHKKTLRQQSLLAQVASIGELVETTLDNSKGYQCTLCAIFLHSADVALSHVQGTRHKLKRQGIDVTAAGGGGGARGGYGGHSASAGKTYAIQSVMSAYGNSSHNGTCGGGSGAVQRYSTGAVNKTIKPIGAGDRGAGGASNTLFKCDLCNCTSNSMSQLAAHTQGAKHKQNAQSAAPNGASAAVPAAGGGVSSLPYGISRTEISGEFSCRLCSVVTNSSVQLEQHLQSQRHRLAVRGGGPGGGGDSMGGATRSSLASGSRGRKPYQRYSGVGRGAGMVTSPWSASSPYDSSGLAAAAAVVAANSAYAAGGPVGAQQQQQAAVTGPGAGGAGGYTTGMVSSYVSMAGYSQQAAAAAAAAADYAVGGSGAAAPAPGQYGAMAQYGAAGSAASYSAGSQFDMANSYNRNFYLAKQPPPPPPVQKSYMKTSNYV